MGGFLKQIQERDKKRKETVIARLGKEETLYMGDPSLQWATGGWVRGRANLVYGVSGSGKSTLVLKGAAEEQKKTGGYVLVLDSEYAHHDPNEVDEDTGKLTDAAQKARERYIEAGLDPDKMIVRSSNQVDELFYGLSDLADDVKKGDLNISAIIVDSWGGIQSEGAAKKIAKGEIGAAGNSFGGNAKTMGPVLQEILRLSAENAITTFFVQHCINNMDEYGPRYILIGGQKLRFLVHMVLFVESVQAKDASLLSDGTATTKETAASDIIYKIGKKIRFRCEKSRKVVEGRTGEFWFDFAHFRFALPGTSLFNLSTSLGVVAHPRTVEMETKGPNKGSPKLDKNGKETYKENNMMWEFPAGAPGASKWKGQEAMKNALNTERDLFNQVFEACMKSPSLAGTKTEVAKVQDVSEEAGANE